MSDSIQKFKELTKDLPKVPNVNLGMYAFNLVFSESIRGNSFNLEQRLFGLLKTIIKEPQQDKQVLFILLEKLVNQNLLDDYSIKDVTGFLDDNKYEPKPDSGSLGSLKEWHDRVRASRNKPPWETFYSEIFERVEIRNFKKNGVLDVLNEILNIYGYKYDLQLDIRTFTPGTKTFNPAKHEEFRKTRSSHPHNTIIEVLKMGIISQKNGTYFRKALVHVSFGL